MSSAQPIKCLVIQLARLGDTLQSLMALRAIHQYYPNLEIHFEVIGEKGQRFNLYLGYGKFQSSANTTH